MSEWLPNLVFEQGIATLPLVSIDLIIKDEMSGHYLLGLRKNRPAESYWFVPGGRIRKNERLDSSFLRLTEVEIGCAISMSSAYFKGVYQHFYDDCVFGVETSTHYVVLAYELALCRDELVLPSGQHSQYEWLSAEEILARMDVHQHSKDYFLRDT
jgi:colanic acid biosynthesis protein WcaH